MSVMASPEWWEVCFNNVAAFAKLLSRDFLRLKEYGNLQMELQLS